MKSKRFGTDSFMYLVKGTRESVCNQISYCYNAELDPQTFKEVMKSHDVVFWKEVINEEMNSIIDNNTWELVALPLGCYWI